MSDMNQVPQSDWSDQQKWEYLLRHERLGELLVKWGKLTLAQVDDLLQEQKTTSKHLGELVVERKLLTLDEIMHELKLQSDMDETARQTIDELKKLADGHKKAND